MQGVKSFVFMENLIFWSSILALILAGVYISLSNTLVEYIYVLIEMIKYKVEIFTQIQRTRPLRNQCAGSLKVIFLTIWAF